MSQAMYRVRTAILLAAVLVPALGGAGARPLAALADPVTPSAPVFADSAFSRVWARTDSAAVNSGRSWYWGPAQFSGPIIEPMQGLPGGRNQRLVQYFDKSRMEINDPNGDRNSKWFVTNGLLTVELISGKMQIGLNQYENRSPADIPLASDLNDANAPTYRSFAAVADTPLTPRPAANATGQQVVLSVSKANPTPQNTGRYNARGVFNAHYVAETQHNIPGVFWNFLNQQGAVLENGSVANQALNDPWNFATGYPISEAYWATVLVGGQPTDVLIQCFQRRVLTYTPTNQPAWQVQMGNIGQHYVKWRYPDGLPGQAAIYDRTGNGGEICRGGTAPPEGCPFADTDPASPNHAAYRNDLLRTRAGGTLGAQTLDAKFRLLSESQMQIKTREDLNPGQNFLFSLGQVLYDINVGRNGAGEIVIDTGSSGIIRVNQSARLVRAFSLPGSLLDTEDGHVYLSVSKTRDGQLKLGAFHSGMQLTVNRHDFVLPSDQQVHIAGNGQSDFATEQLDAQTAQLWATFSDNGNLSSLPPGAGNPFDLQKCQGFNKVYPDLADERLGCPVADPHFFSSDAGAAGSYGDPKAPTRLFRDDLSDTPTLYVLHPVTNRAVPPTWETYDANSDNAGKVFGRVGERIVECNPGVYAIQRYAGGAVLWPPVLTPGAGACARDETRIYILYQDGTWREMRIQQG